MGYELISGTEIGKKIRAELKEEVEKLKNNYGVVPGLVTILVGHDPASATYVGGKQKAANELGFYSVKEELPEDVSEEKLIEVVKRYNEDPKIHGVLVQLPLPKHIDEKKVICAIDPKKDVDVFHPENLGKLLMGEWDLLPCAPHGIWQMLIRSGVKIEGSEVVILGRSDLVGKPMSAILMQDKPNAKAIVTICDENSPDFTFHTKRADILIVDIGKPKFVKADMVKEGVVVIDCGNHWLGSSPDGKPIICGDVDFEEVKEKASKITPVPGGVGPMIIAMLMFNTVKAAKMALGVRE